MPLGLYSIFTFVVSVGLMWVKREKGDIELRSGDCVGKFFVRWGFRQKRVDKVVGWWYYQCARGAEVSAERVPLNLSS